MLMPMKNIPKMTLASDVNGSTRSVYVFVMVVVPLTVVIVVPLCSSIPSMRIAPAMTISQNPAMMPKIGFIRYRLLTKMMRKTKSMIINTISNTTK